jgi:hypothetical protein
MVQIKPSLMTLLDDSSHSIGKSIEIFVISPVVG